MADKIEIIIEGQDKAKGAFSSASSGLGGLLKTATGFATGMGIFSIASAAVGGFGSVIKDAITASADEQAVMAQTQAVIKSTGDASGMTAEQVAALANHLQDVTTFGNETVQAGENMLLTFTNIGKDVFPQATQTLLDMSQAMGSDPKQAAIQLGKALNDPVQGITALTRVGVTFTDQQKDVIKQMVETGDTAGAQKVILDELNKEFGGSATAATKSFGGQMAQLKNQIGDAEKALSYALLPVIANLAQAVVPKLITVIQFLGREAPIAIGFIVDKATALWNLLKGPLNTAFVLVRDSVLTFAQALSGNWTDNSKIEGIHRVIGNIGLVIRNQVIPAVERFGSFMTGTVIPAIQRFAHMAVQFIVGQVIPAVQRFAAFVTGTVVPAIEHFATVAQQFIVGQVIPAFEKIRDTVQPILERIVGFVRDNWKSVLAGAAAILLTVVVPAFVAWALSAGAAAIATIAAAAPVIAILAAIGIAAGALYLAWSSNFLNIQGIVGAIWDFIKPILQAIIDNLSQFWTDVLPKLQAAWENVREKIGEAVAAIQSVVVPIFQAIAGFIQDHADTIKGILSGVWEVIQGIIQTNVAIIEGIIKTFLDILSGNWSGAWDDIKQMLSDVWDGMKNIIHGFIDILKGEVTLVVDAVKDLWKPAWDAIKQVVSDAWDGIKNAISDAKDGVVNAVQGVIDGIKGKFSDAKDWLFDAGKAIIQGLIDGIENMLGSLKDKLSGITDLIPSWKGPIDKDRKLLFGSGVAIMQGFMNGIGSQVPALASQLTGISNMVGSLTSPYAGGGHGAGYEPGAGPIQGQFDLQGNFQQFASGGINSGPAPVTNVILNGRTIWSSLRAIEDQQHAAKISHFVSS